MTVAPVGYQCPECIRSGRSRHPTTRFGGRVGRDGAGTTALISVCIAGFLFVGLLGGFGGNARWGMQPIRIALGGEWWRLGTAILMHAGVLHLALNMYMLHLLGLPLERLLGRLRLVLLFALSGLGGSVASFALSPVTTLSVGASGGIFGLMAASIVMSKRLQADYNQLLGLLAVNIVLGFVLPGIDWRAHLGGALVGALTAWVLTVTRGRQGSADLVRQAVLVVGLLLGMVGIVAWRTDAILSMVLF
jgi:membrane associated rhomboid family serine protease